eukprot:jgi/Botrbrau1/6520/Bobra.0034s0092.1
MRGETHKRRKKQCGRITVLDLPENVLVVLLGHLLCNPNHIRAARMVCRSFRAASISHITHVVVDPYLRSVDGLTEWRGREAPLQLLLARNLQQFQCLTCLAIGIGKPEHACLVSIQGVAPVLRELTLHERSYQPGGQLYGPRWLKRLAAATGLTRLVMAWDAPPRLTTAVLQACPNLLTLQVGGPGLWSLTLPHSRRGMDGHTHASVIASASGLRSLTLGETAPYEMVPAGLFAELLPALTGLRNLQDLQGMKGCTADEAVHVEHLTALTALQAPWTYHDHMFGFVPLRQLTNLRTLGLRLGRYVEFEYALKSLGRLSHLRDLTLRGSASSGRLPRSGCLAPFQHLNSLRLPPEMALSIDDLSLAPLTALRRLQANISVISPAAAVLSMAASLQRMEELDLVKYSSTLLDGFYPHLPAMTGLRSLRLELCDCPRLPQVELPPVAWLTALTRLSILALLNVMDAQTTAQDVRYLAALRELTNLTIVGVGEAARVTELVEAGGLQPLTALRMLCRLYTGGAWRLGSEPSFVAAVNRAKWEMGSATCLIVDGLRYSYRRPKPTL